MNNSKTKKILFVCHGNICRSPMAEFVMKQMVREAGVDADFEIASAAVSTEELGNDVYSPAKRKLQEKQVSFAHRAARQITLADYRYYDYIVVMDKSNLRWLGGIIGADRLGKVSRLMEWAGETKDVADPWYTNDFEQAFQDIEKGCRAMLQQLA